MKTLSVSILPIPCIDTAAQSIIYEPVEILIHQLPLHPLKVDTNTFSVSVTDLGNQLSHTQIGNVEQNITIPGFQRDRENAAVAIEIIISPLTIIQKELRDNPFTIEKNGVKTIYHNYDYFLSCTFPTKLRVTANGSQVFEQDFPAFFQTKYDGNGAKTESAMLSNWESDYSFKKNLLKERLTARLGELQKYLSDCYGSHVIRQYFSVGYIKDRKNEYADINKATALIRDLLLYASNKKMYAGEPSRKNAQHAIDILGNILAEANTDKKARIDQRVKGLIHYNLALLRFFMHEFSEAEEHLNLAGSGSRNTWQESENLREKIRDQRKRLTANGLPKEGLTISTARTGGLSSRSQSPSQGDYIVGMQNDTLELKFILPAADAMPLGDTVWLQEKIVIKEHDKPVSLYPDQIKGFFFGGRHYEALWWVEDTQTKPWTIARKFCRRILSGAIPVYSCNEVVKDDEGYKTVRSNLFYKQDQQYKSASFLHFNRGVSKLISDHTALSKKVREGNFRREDFLAIIREYNKYHEPKTSH